MKVMFSMASGTKDTEIFRGVVFSMNTVEVMRYENFWDAAVAAVFASVIGAPFGKATDVGPVAYTVFMVDKYRRSVAFLGAPLSTPVLLAISGDKHFFSAGGAWSSDRAARDWNMLLRAFAAAIYGTKFIAWFSASKTFWARQFLCPHLRSTDTFTKVVPLPKLRAFVAHFLTASAGAQHIYSPIRRPCYG